MHLDMGAWVGACPARDPLNLGSTIGKGSLLYLTLKAIIDFSCLKRVCNTSRNANIYPSYQFVTELSLHSQNRICGTSLFHRAGALSDLRAPTFAEERCNRQFLGLIFKSRLAEKLIPLKE